MDIIDNLKGSIINNTILKNISDNKYKYLFRYFSEYKDCSYDFKILNYKWDGNKEYREFEYRDNTHFLQDELTLIGNLTVSKSGILLKAYNNIKLNIRIDIYFNINTNKYIIDIVDLDKSIIKQYTGFIDSIIKEYNIKSLEPNEGILLKGKNTLAFYIDIIRKPRGVKFKFKNGDNIVYNDIIRCSTDLKYLIGELLLVKPYVTNYLDNPIPYYGKTVYTYYPTYMDKRYYLISQLVAQTFYNFWDRIGNLLANCIDTDSKDKRIYFYNVICNLEKGIYKNSLNLEWLINFKNSEFKELNNKRKNVVHYISIETDNFEKYLKNSSNKALLTQLQKEKEELTDFFVNQFNLTIEGFEKACLLIDEIE